MTAESSLKRLQEGNNRFVQDKLNGELQDSNRRGGLTGGQNPFATVLSCADSRVVPELAFDTGLGEIFVVRVAGNVANMSSTASIEYSVAHLNVPLLVVMGHESCGAVGAALQGGDNGKNLNHLLQHIEPAKQHAGSSEVNDVVKENARQTVKHLVESSEIIKKAVDAGELKIIPAYYNLGSGKVDFDI